MTTHVEFDRLSSALAVWHRYDPTVKAELFSTSIQTASGVYLIDPISLPAEDLSTAIAGRDLAGIVITNRNHARSALDFSRELKIPIFAHPEAAAEFGSNEIRLLDDGSRLALDFVVATMEGAAAGEIALHCEADGGTLVFGDALINMGAEGFTFLPAKYCLNPKQMRASLRKFRDYRFQRILLAHGTPIISRAESRLAELHDSGR